MEIIKYNDYKFVDSSSDMSRLLNTFDKGFFIISAFRSSFDLDEDLPNYEDLVKAKLNEYNVDYNYFLSKYKFNDIEKVLLNKWNLAKTKELENILRSYGLGFRVSLGGFIEDGQEQAEEMSFLVPYINNIKEEDFKNIALELCKKYNQDSVLIKTPSMNNPILLNQNGGIDLEFNTNPKLNTSNEDYFTKTQKTNSKPFTFQALVDSVSSKELKVESHQHNLRLRYNRNGWSK